MTNTDKILAAFDEWIKIKRNEDIDFHYGVGTWVVTELKSFLITKIAEAVTEERKRLVDEAKDFIKDVKLSPAQFERFINWIFINS